MKIVAGAFSLGSLGHLIRTCRAASLLAARGHDVLFLCAEESQPIAREYGLATVAVPELVPTAVKRDVRNEADLRALAKSRIAAPAYLERCANAERPILDSLRPDVIIASARHTLCVLGKERGIPVINLMNVKHLASPMPIVFPCLIESLMELGFSESAALGVFGDVLAIPGFASYEPLSDTDPGLWSLLRANVREIRYLGPFAPCLEPRAALASASASASAGVTASERALYISLGGAASVGRDLPLLLEKLRVRSERFVVHTGSHVTPEQVAVALQRPLGPRLACFAFAKDNFERLRACQVAISHGGHGSVYETLFAGVPSLTLPALQEQRDNGLILERLGMGIVEATTVAPDRLNRALDSLFDEPHFKANAELAAASVQNRNGLSELARLVESHVL